ncbi:MAG: ATP-binding protein [Candidatus Omnitrophota bacterium]
MIQRPMDSENIRKLLDMFPVVAILGPRQCGKTTISKEFHAQHFFDLENPRDTTRLEHPQLALENLTGLIVIDEVQRMPDLFPLIRYMVDNNPNQKFLVLGSASRDLLRQSSESLAGRIGYYNLEGFGISDVGTENFKQLWIRGGFPRSFIAASDEESLIWRENYITTFLEKDIPQLGIQIPAQSLRRFWKMLSHYHARVINYSELGRSFGISDTTIKKYIDILESTFMVRVHPPWYANVGKRLVKSPKIYIKDSGIFHSLMAIETEEQLEVHHKLGASWEGFALECVARSINKRNEEMYFWSTFSGAEVDLCWQKGGKNWGVEFKYMDAPKLTKSMHSAIKDLELEHLWIIYPGNERYRLEKMITVLPLKQIPARWEYE